MNEPETKNKAMVAFVHAVDEAYGLRDAVKREVRAKAGSMVAFVQGVDETYGVREKVETKARAVKSRLLRGARARFRQVARAVVETVNEVAPSPVPLDANAPKIYPLGFKVEIASGATVVITIAPEWNIDRPMKAVGLRLYEGALFFEVNRIECQGRCLLEQPVPGEYFREPRPMDWDCIVTHECPLMVTVTNNMPGPPASLVGVVELIACPQPKQPPYRGLRGSFGQYRYPSRRSRESETT